LADALDSLLAQTYQDFELIVSDNCSTDSTLEICKKYACLDSRIRWISQSENMGPIPNFCFVLQQSSCPYFMWAAADDLWSPNYLQEAISLLEHSPAAFYAAAPYKCSSIRSPLFSRRTSACLEIITISNATQRLKAYAGMPLSWHKDNLIYALYRTDFLKNCVEELSIHVFGRRFIGGPINDLIVFHGKGVFVPGIKFYKRYNLFPPRGVFDHAISRVMSIPRRLGGLVARGEIALPLHVPSASELEYVFNLKRVFEYASLTEEEIEGLVQNYLADNILPVF